MKQRYEQNIVKFIIFNALSSFVLYYGIDKVFMAARGLTTTEIVSVELVCATLIILLEVPLGALSDRWSRKYVLALNVVFFAVNTLAWVMAEDLSLFLVGTTAAAIHMALRSGTDTSFLYDTLDQLGRTHEYEKVLGRSIFWENLFAIPAGIVGPLIADRYGLPVPFWLTLPFSLAAAVVALTFTEPGIHRSTQEVSYWRHIGDTGRYLIGHPGILPLIGVGIILGTTLSLLDEYLQLYIVSIGVPVFMLGSVVAGGHAIEAIAGRWSYRATRFPHRGMYLVALTGSALGFLGMCLLGGSWYAIPFALAPWIAYYTVNPIVLGDLHRSLDSSQRATGESFMSLMKNVVMIPLALAFGLTADSASLAMAYGVLGVVVVGYAIIFGVATLERRSPGRQGRIQ